MLPRHNNTSVKMMDQMVYRLFMGVYQTLTFVASPLVWILFYYAYRHDKERTQWVAQRMGYSAPHDTWQKKKIVWIHGADIGELRSATVLMDQLYRTDPHVRIVLTTQSIQALRMMRQGLAGHDHIALHLAPFDSPQWVGRFLDRWNPSSFCVMEAEIWPCLWHQTFVRNIQSCVINFHISEKSARFWKRLSPVLTSLYRSFSKRWSGCSASIHRFQKLTHDALPIKFSPTLKYASTPVKPTAPILQKYDPERRQRPVWMASCGHKNDEPFFESAHQFLLKKDTSTLWIYAPRHIQRVPDIMHQCQKHGWTVCKHSEYQKHNISILPHCQVYIIDTLGDLDTFYQQLPFVVMGGSFYPSGRGHNLIEPLACLCPPLYGPFMNNCLDVVQDCQNYVVGKQVQPYHLSHDIATALDQPETTKLWGKNGKNLLHDRVTALQKDLENMTHALLNTDHDD